MLSRRKTVQRKLTELLLGTSFSLLALTLLGLGAYEVHAYRQTTARSLSSIAEIIAQNSAAVLLFDDQKMAQEVLGSLRAESEVSMAALFDQSGALYATYPKDLPRSAFPQSPNKDGVHLALRSVTLWKPVQQGETRAGTIYFYGDLQGTYQRLGVLAVVFALIGVGGTVVAIALNHFLQRRISEPLGDLAAAARKITREKDLSIRAQKTSDDELGDLTDALNAMLDQVHLSTAALHEQEGRFRTLADNMVQLAWMADSEGKFVWYNKRWHDYTGLDFQASQQMGWDTVHPNHRGRLESEFMECFRSGREWKDTFPLRGADGKFRWFLSNAIPIRASDGRLLHWFGTNTDVTELREIHHELRAARDQAIAASAAKDDFLARLSHELRTPLSPVLLIVSDNKENYKLPLEVQTDFETIKKNVELEARLIDDLLDLTAIVKGKLVLHLQKQSLNNIVLDAIAKVKADALLKHITIADHLDVTSPIIECDPVRVQQAVWNVLKNAVKFSREGDTVAVVTQLDDSGNYLKVTITDQGLGMSPQELGRVFDAFAQGDHAESGGSHRYGGLGLGLAISRRVVELHGGKISATSPGVHKGSTFIIELPATTHSSTGETRDTPTPFSREFFAQRRTHQTLLVEDHDATRVALSRLLKRRGFDVTCAASLAEARAVFSTKTFELLISDIGLPDGTGYDLMREFRTESEIVGVALTGYGMEADVASARDAGFCVHLTKPINVEALDEALRVASRQLAAKSGGG